VLVVVVVQTQILEFLELAELVVVETVVLKDLVLQLMVQQTRAVAVELDPPVLQLLQEGQELLSCVTTQH
jgi:hypothetical protein